MASAFHPHGSCLAHNGDKGNNNGNDNDDNDDDDDDDDDDYYYNYYYYYYCYYFLCVKTPDAEVGTCLPPPSPSSRLLFNLLLGR